MHTTSLIRRFPWILNLRPHLYNTTQYSIHTIPRCKTSFITSSIQRLSLITTATPSSSPSQYDQQSQQENHQHDTTNDDTHNNNNIIVSELSDVTTATSLTSQHQSPKQQQQQHTGAFQKIPMVSPSKELIESALRRAERVGGNKKLKNEAAKARNRAARQMDALMKELTGPLGFYEKGFPAVHRLHPFEQALLNLTLTPGSYEKAISQVSAVRKASVEVAKGYAARASKAVNKKEAVALQIEGFSKVEAVYNRGAHAIDTLKDIAKMLRRLPVVDPALPTVALVGAPNVGKSSLVQLLSSGVPEVQNYPFTTRSIKMGHFYVDNRRHQVTDTPGLLNRPDEKRNSMERLTLASLEHLPTAVLFVMDLTGECGTTVEDQWKIRVELKERFPGKPWLDVMSKRDLLEEEFDEADERRIASLLLSDSNSSGSDNTNIDTTNTTNNTNTTTTTNSIIVKSAVDCAMALPDALRISSKTGDGIDELKLAMLKMIEGLQNEGIEAWPEEDDDEDNNTMNSTIGDVMYYEDEGDGIYSDNDE